MADVEEAGWPEGEADGDEEPLFADDISDNEDDPPPLPPPMPSLGELSASRPRGRPPSSGGATTSGDGGNGVFSGTQQAAGGDPNTAQGTGANDQEPPQKKRKPILTLTVDRIFSEKGLSYVEKEFPKLKFRGKGHEASDMKYLMQQYEQWANMLYPKLTFKDVTDRIEALASKKDFKSQLLLMRRRAARGGRATPPLNSDDSNDEEGGAGAGDESRRPPGSGSGTPEENDRNGAGDSGSSGEHSGGGSTNRIQDSENMIVSNGVTDNSGDLMGGANENGESLGNSALTKLTMDAYSSESDDD